MKNEKVDEKLSKKFIVLICVICLMLLCFFLVCIIVNVNTKPKEILKEKNGGYVTLNYSSNNNVLINNNPVPLTNDVGIKLNTEGTFFDFTVNADLKSAKKVKYEISVKKSNDSQVSDNDIIVYLEKEDSGMYNSFLNPTKYKPLKSDSNVGTKKGTMILVSDVVTKSRADNYRLRTWISNTGSNTNSSYSLEVNVKAVVM